MDILTLIESHGSFTTQSIIASIFDGAENVGRGFYGTYLDLTSMNNSTDITGGITIRVDVRNTQTTSMRSAYNVFISSDVVNQFEPIYFIPFVPADDYDVRINGSALSSAISISWVLYKQPQV